MAFSPVQRQNRIVKTNNRAIAAADARQATTVLTEGSSSTMNLARELSENSIVCSERSEI